ncbi:lactate utilization protein [Haloarcula nitratireducens]|uniref:Lactate utilization protein n=1 Tax=Haloarcula nitratireducens TaxID=2487749 RepID=A0AAW4PDH8_9EURY|nr:lactate utilization protein [Halomicroarcula nitratireducens]MBX0295979.1 lactate utilization protein [Halomicroarcula nitratireducens]
MSRNKDGYADSVSYDESLDERPSDEELDAAVENLRSRGFDVVVVEDGDAALAELRERIPAGASVMDGHSTTLEEIGFMDYLMEGDHDWENRHAEVYGIDDDAERQRARREAQASDYFLGSVNAVAATGELVAADASGSRIGAYPFAAENLLLVAGTNKIVDDLDAALDRLEDVAYPLEDARAEDAYGTGSMIGKQLIYRQEAEEGRTTLVLAKESLGY